MKRSQIEVIGFLVVRLPQLNLDPSSRGLYSILAPPINGAYYGGIERMPWRDLERLEVAGALARDEAEALRGLDAENTDYPDVKVCRDLCRSMTLLTAANADSRRNELIVIRDTLLSQIKGVVSVPETSVIWLGYDCLQLHGWSLLHQGLFFSPEQFPGWASRVGPNGLFDSPKTALAFKSAYDRAASEGRVEELPLDAGATAIQVGRVIAVGTSET